MITKELFWLTCTVILTGLLWVPYVLNRCQVRGLGGAMANPSRNDKPHAEWANRLMFAHDNAVENLVIFAPLVLILNAINYSSKWTVLACAVYFWARVAHLIVYDVGNQDSVGLGKSLQACGYVDAIPEDVTAIQDDVADVDADAQLYPRVAAGAFAGDDVALDFDGAA